MSMNRTYAISSEDVRPGLFASIGRPIRKPAMSRAPRKKRDRFGRNLRSHERPSQFLGSLLARRVQNFWITVVNMGGC